jgi:hypothetical protein
MASTCDVPELSTAVQLNVDPMVVGMLAGQVTVKCPPVLSRPV